MSDDVLDEEVHKQAEARYEKRRRLREERRAAMIAGKMPDSTDTNAEIAERARKEKEYHRMLARRCMRNLRARRKKEEYAAIGKRCGTKRKPPKVYTPEEIVEIKKRLLKLDQPLRMYGNGNKIYFKSVNPNYKNGKKKKRAGKGRKGDDRTDQEKQESTYKWAYQSIGSCMGLFSGKTISPEEIHAKVKEVLDASSDGKGSCSSRLFVESVVTECREIIDKGNKERSQDVKDAGI